MHISNNENNFRNKKYLAEADKEFKRMFRAYHKYISYRNKLKNELTMSKEDEKELQTLDEKFVKNISLAYKRIKRGDFE